jgi:hypothetical protein
MVIVPYKGVHRRWHTHVGSALISKFLTMLKNLVRDKHSSLFCHVVTDCLRQNELDFCPWPNFQPCLRSAGMAGAYPNRAVHSSPSPTASYPYLKNKARLKMFSSDKHFSGRFHKHFMHVTYDQNRISWTIHCTHAPI